MYAYTIRRAPVQVFFAIELRFSTGVTDAPAAVKVTGDIAAGDTVPWPACGKCERAGP